MYSTAILKTLRAPRRSHVRDVSVSSRRRDVIASKYCFSARCQILAGDLETASIGLVFGYDAKPTISRDVEDVCRIFCNESGYTPGDVELFMHTECPVELHNEVFVTVFETPLDEDVSLDAMHKIAIRDQFQRPKPSSRPKSDEDDDDQPPPPPPPFFPRGNPPDGGSPPGGGGGKGGPGGSIHRVPKEPSGGGGGYELALP